MICANYWPKMVKLVEEEKLARIPVYSTEFERLFDFYVDASLDGKVESTADAKSLYSRLDKNKDNAVN